jgi:Ca-activated chloride channel family protein
VHVTTRRTAAALVGALLLAACLPALDGEVDDGTGVADVDVGDCIALDVSVSSEKIDLMRDLGEQFDGDVDGRCVVVRVQSKPSGGAATLLSDGWDEDVEGPRPVLWSPASSAWGAVVDQRLRSRGEEPVVAESVPFMQTPLVIAMPQPMAEALGWPDAPIGWSDILELARGDEGWAAYGHPEWGPFRLGKTNPNFSTSGLSALVAQTYAAAGKDRDLTREDLRDPAVTQFATTIERSVVHYGPTTLTFLNNWYRNDARGTALTYASAAAVEEVSIVQYNRGNPDGRLDPGEEPREPRIPLVAVYPAEGTLFSDNPLLLLDADWVDEEEAAAAAQFRDFVLLPENQERVLDFGFRPGNPDVPIGPPIVSENGVDPTQPQTTLEVPDPEVLVELIESWEDTRKAANVLLVMDVSGSMSEPAVAGGTETKLDLATRAAIDALDQFAPQDRVGLRVFTTGAGPAGADGTPADFVDLVEVAPIGQGAEKLRSAIRSLVPLNGTPLYDVALASYEDVLASYDPDAINAIVLLTDGINDDGDLDDDDAQLQALLDRLGSGVEGASARPVRVFTIAYGEDADQATMRAIAEASDAATYDASDPSSIDDVFTAVISNF